MDVRSSLKPPRVYQGDEKLELVGSGVRDKNGNVYDGILEKDGRFSTPGIGVVWESTDLWTKAVACEPVGHIIYEYGTQTLCGDGSGTFFILEDYQSVGDQFAWETDAEHAAKFLAHPWFHENYEEAYRKAKESFDAEKLTQGE